MRKKIGVLCMGVGAALLIAALALLVYNRTEDDRAGAAAEDVLLEMLLENRQPEGTAPPESAPADSVHADETELTVVEIDGYGYIGYLSIPVLELELPVMCEWDDDRLKIAPCRYFGSPKTDDLVICGHNYDRHFGRLKNLQAGDLVLFTDMDGEASVYAVKTVETLQPTQISEMIASDYDLSLYTCTYGGTARVTVRCDRAEEAG